jgi:prepilin-type processing-associated H-X9-DG protein
VNFDPGGFIDQDGAPGKECHIVTGTSYRLNNHIDFLNSSGWRGQYFYGPYMRPRSRVPDAGQTVVLEEAIAEVSKWNPANWETMGWHRKVNVFNVAFVDGHAGSITLSGQNDNSDLYPDYWVLRGNGWRMDCYPEPRICDIPNSCN